jgi:hypothetical protein
LKRHIRVELDTQADLDFDLDNPTSEFFKALRSLNYYSGSGPAFSVEICELTDDGKHCRKHITQGVHKTE